MSLEQRKQHALVRINSVSHCLKQQNKTLCSLMFFPPDMNQKAVLKRKIEHQTSIENVI